MNILKHLLLIFSLILITSSFSYAQQNNVEDVLYLKDGSILRGEIIEELTQTVRIRLIGGSELVIKTENIIERKEEKKYAPERPFHNKKRGIYSLSSLGLHYDFDNNLDLLLETSIGYQIDPRLAIGIGSNITSYNGNVFVPIFGEIRGEILANKAVTPIYYGSFGWGLKLDRLKGFNQYEENDAYIAYGLGLKIKSPSSLNFTISIGQQLQKYNHFSFWPGNGWDTADQLTKTEIRYSRIQFKFGIGF